MQKYEQGRTTDVRMLHVFPIGTYKWPPIVVYSFLGCCCFLDFLTVTGLAWIYLYYFWLAFSPYRLRIPGWWRKGVRAAANVASYPCSGGVAGRLAEVCSERWLHACSIFQQILCL